MSFLYPLILAGLAAVGIPIVLHMVRQRTRNRVRFSSLMFVPAAMSRFKNRSRIENVLLLLVRCVILCLLAFAFSRPFFPRPLSDDTAPGAKRTVVLIDTSASMRRTGMWTKALAQVESVLQDAGRADRLCIMSFDQTARTIIGFEQAEQLDPAQRVSVANELMTGLSPGWAQTDLGNALVAAAEAIEDDEVNDAQQPVAGRRIVLISDLQQGSRLEALRDYEWPKDAELVVKSIEPAGTTNAALQLVTDTDDLANPRSDNGPRIRITNSPDAATERFELRWADDATAAGPNEPMSVYVAPGRSVVVRAPARANPLAGRELILTGDDHEFDNALYIAPYLQQQINILYIGSEDANDPKEMLFYIERAFAATTVLKPHLVVRRPDKAVAAEDIEAADMVIVTDALALQNIPALRQHLESGRTLLLAMKSTAAAQTLAGLAQIDDIKAVEAEVEQYTMLAPIEFTHPLLAPFSEPRFGDFTQIHFWKYRRIDIADCPGARVLAWFDTSDPALFELTVGKGSLLVLTCGWNRADSQLALSSKFVPLLYSILEYGGVLANRQLQYFVGDSVPVTHETASGSASLRIRKPDGSVISFDADQQAFTQTDLPGIYTIESAAENRLFAVNLPVQECRTAPMPIEDLEKLGVPLDHSPGAPAEHITKARRYSSLARMEYEQKLWRCLLLVLLIVALAETALAGWLTRPAPISQENKND
jgi:hypothetical protein